MVEARAAGCAEAAEGLLEDTPKKLLVGYHLKAEAPNRNPKTRVEAKAASCSECLQQGTILLGGLEPRVIRIPPKGGNPQVGTPKIVSKQGLPDVLRA